MAEKTLIQAIAFLEGLPRQVGRKGAEIMNEEFNAKPHPYSKGKTPGSFRYEVYGGGFIFIFSDTPGAKWVEKGRGAVYPKRKPFLAWKSPDDKWVYAKSSRPVKPDDYIGRTAKRLQNTKFH